MGDVEGKKEYEMTLVDYKLGCEQMLNDAPQRRDAGLLYGGQAARTLSAGERKD
jgi:hypothetical protein